jgi:hypothetical protein
MRMVIRRIPVAALALCLGTAHLSAQQQPGNSTFQWYVGGQGGIMNFETSAQGRSTIPMGGAHLLVTAKRTGLLLSVEQGFGNDEASAYNFTVFDSTGVPVSSTVVTGTFNYIRKYSAMLMAFPIKGPATPYFGLGVGIMNAGGHNPEDDVANELGSTGFGSFMAGLNFRVSRLSAFGQYQVTTGSKFHSISVAGPQKATFVYSGNILKDAVHTFSAGLRFGLGSARESVKSGGY